MPMMATLTESIGPRDDTAGYSVRVGVVVFPIRNGGKNDQMSPANAAIVSSLTSSKTELLALINDGTGVPDDIAANESLRFPASKWTYTPTWSALQLAEDLLYGTNVCSVSSDIVTQGCSDADNTTNKAVIVVTDGAPSQYQFDSVGGNYARQVGVYI